MYKTIYHYNNIKNTRYSSPPNTITYLNLIKSIYPSLFKDKLEQFYCLHKELFNKDFYNEFVNFNKIEITLSLFIVDKLNTQKLLNDVAQFIEIIEKMYNILIDAGFFSKKE